MARRIALGVAGAALALLGGCVVAPVEPYEIGAPVVYSGTVYTPYYGGTYYGAPTYYYGAPVYQPYWRPSMSLGIWGGGRHWHGRGDRHWHGNPGRGNRWQGNAGNGGAFRGGREGGIRRP
ncbi:MAG: hypothetical protein Q4G70_03220 [Pseudomonadota bacterium]|nr:hypothetical protein [Pseudomonadota bacterium]